jgi:hypothetical protein
MFTRDKIQYVIPKMNKFFENFNQKFDTNKDFKRWTLYSVRDFICRYVHTYIYGGPVGML